VLFEIIFNFASAHGTKLNLELYHKKNFYHGKPTIFLIQYFLTKNPR